jgi:formate dehydrogenase accessory protein FdhE
LHDRWTARVARARHLAGVRAEAAALLSFYASLAAYQSSLVNRWYAHVDRQAPPRTLLESLDIRLPLGAVGDTIDWLEQSAPDGLRHHLPALREVTAAGWSARLEAVLGDGVDEGASEDAPEDAVATFVVDLLVQPLAEHLAVRSGPPVSGQGDRCPFCAGPPVAGMLREEGQGTRRLLVCGRCLTEWNCARVGCVACGEQRFESLPVYTAGQTPGVRVEGCDTCRRYLKTFDLSVDGLQIPLVDDLATVTLDLWAREQGYTRSRGHVLRV